jgi:hypothetical protein
VKHYSADRQKLTKIISLFWEVEGNLKEDLRGCKVLVNFACGRSDGDVLHVEADHPSGIPALGDRQL